MNQTLATLLATVYVLGDLATTVYLIFFDGTDYNWWNWIILIPIDVFLGTIWPIYWMLSYLFF